MKVHVLQHVSSEGLGSIEAWLNSVGADVTFTYFFESADLPAAHEQDLVIALGGPMSVNDEATLPWLRAEKQFIREAIDSGKAVLGICLGSQLIATALRARVYPNQHKEIGWFPVTAVPNNGDVFHLPASVEVFHWHGETFELPQGAEHLARSVACENQGFQIGRRVIGLQFHLETTQDSARAFVEEDNGNELVDAPYIQTAQQILDAPLSAYSGINALMVDVLNYLAAD
jgi:GMP synthase-like glutamine amidotransferase